MNKSVPVGLVGIGGHGRRHLWGLRTLQSAGICHIKAVADPFAHRLPHDVAALKSEGVEIFDDARELCEREDIAAVLITTPIHLHTPQTLVALEAGKHVYLEKPPCATLHELAQLIHAQERAQKICAVGFQQQTVPASKFAKKQIVSGAIGDLKTVRASIRWSREDSYYARAAWAGKWQLGGQPVFDGPATNALAHVVHAALFLAGETEDAWPGVLQVRGSLRKARPIESYDSAFLEIETRSGVLVRLAFTHATDRSDAVALNCTGTKGRLSLDWTGEVALAPDGEEEQNWSFGCDAHYMGLFDFFGALQSEGADCKHAPSTTLEDTRPYLQATSGALQSSGGSQMFSEELITPVGEPPHRYFSVAGLDDELGALARDENALPSLLTPGPWVAADDISSTPSFETPSKMTAG